VNSELTTHIRIPVIWRQSWTWHREKQNARVPLIYPSFYGEKDEPRILEDIWMGWAGVGIKRIKTFSELENWLFTLLQWFSKIKKQSLVVHWEFHDLLTLQSLMVSKTRRYLLETELPFFSVFQTCQAFVLLPHSQGPCTWRWKVSTWIFVFVNGGGGFTTNLNWWLEPRNERRS
jgi:hypothetical protein